MNTRALKIGVCIFIFALLWPPYRVRYASGWVDIQFPPLRTPYEAQEVFWPLYIVVLLAVAFFTVVIAHLTGDKNDRRA